MNVASEPITGAVATESNAACRSGSPILENCRMKFGTLPADTSTAPPVTALRKPRAFAPETLHAPTR